MYSPAATVPFEPGDKERDGAQRLREELRVPRGTESAEWDSSKAQGGRECTGVLATKLK